MANTLVPQDVYQIVNQMIKEATGRNDLAVADTSSFVSVGETLVRVAPENTLNALSTVLGRTIFSVRPYKSSLGSLTVTPERWGARIRKIKYLQTGFSPSEDWNTTLNQTQLADGNSVDMYKINKPKAVELNFYGTKVLQKWITRFRDQLSLAFRSESEFIQFMDGVMTEFNNEVELANEARTRLTLINFMAGISSMGLYEVDLTQTFNQRYGTNYTREQLLSSQLEPFMKHMVSTIKTYSSRLKDASALYHANLTGYEKFVQHTPKNRQKMIMLEPLFIESEANVYSSIFNPQYLNIGSYEGVNFWQSQTDPEKISVTPNILDAATGESKTAEAPVNLDYAVGLLFDEEALGVMPQFDYSSTTPFNSAGGYYNMYMHWRFNAYSDFTENAILFVMGAGGETPAVFTNPGVPTAEEPKKTKK